MSNHALFKNCYTVLVSKRQDFNIIMLNRGTLAVPMWQESIDYSEIRSAWGRYTAQDANTAQRLAGWSNLKRPLTKLQVEWNLPFRKSALRWNSVRANFRQKELFINFGPKSFLVRNESVEGWQQDITVGTHTMTNSFHCLWKIFWEKRLPRHLCKFKVIFKSNVHLPTALSFPIKSLMFVGSNATQFYTVTVKFVGKKYSLKINHFLSNFFAAA